MLPDTHTETVPDKLLALVKDFLTETRQQAATVPSVSLDSRFEQDLGLDSLARSELLLRIERAYGIRLAESVISAETPRALLQALKDKGQASAQMVVTPHRASQSQTDRTTPDTISTLVEMLHWHAQHHPDQTAIKLYEDSDQAQPISYGELWQAAERTAAGLQARGIAPAQTVAIMLPTGRAYFASFFGILLAGATPVPIYPPLRPAQLEEHLRRHAKILANAGVRLLITVAEAKTVVLLLRAQVQSLRHIATSAELQNEANNFQPVAVHSQGLAFLQYTSGSTGDPKGVMLSHANLLANIRAMAQRLQVQSDDVFVSWLPLYHDMGLIGACLGSLYQGIPLVIMSPLRFLRRPASWLWALHQHGGTLSAAPNFAYELCLRNITDEELQGLDLSRWRLAANGAEPVSTITMQRFAERMAPYGFSPEALAPVYGLAECSVGLALPKPGRGLKQDIICPDTLSQQGKALPVNPEHDHTLHIPACGHALSGHEIRIVDDHERELGERQEGHIQFRGSSATQGYLHNQQATQNLLSRDGWLRSGDRGYLAGGDIYLTGRTKDMIIRGGRNIYPYELEQVVGELEGVRKGCVAVFATAQPNQASEQIAVVAETRLWEQQQLEALRASIRACSAEVLGQPAEVIECVPPHTVLKTSSGKIRRVAMRELHQSGRLHQASVPVWLQVVRLGLSSIGTTCKQMLYRTGQYLYGCYLYLLLLLGVLPVTLAVLVLPDLPTRWRCVHWLARGVLKLSGLPFQREGLTQLPAAPYIAVCNHASYIDALVLVAALPTPISFVAKQELAQYSLTRFLLGRLGVILVERFDAQRSVQASEQIIDQLKQGVAVLFFPEGTFTRAPGLLPFRNGAFVAAGSAQVPVVPLLLQGSRDILRADTCLPRYGNLRVQALSAIQPAGQDWKSVTALRTQVRAAILEHYAEPDLDWNDSPFAQKSNN